MIIDSHVHIWIQQPDRYPWSPVGGYIPENQASVESLLTIMDANNIDGAVLVQPTPYGWDNSYLLDSAKKKPNRLHTVCLVDPMDPNSATKMKKLNEQSGANGFRFNWNLKPMEEWDRNSNQRFLWDMAAKLGTPLCIQCNLDYVPLLQKLSQQFPNVRVVVDHLGKPVIQSGIQQQKFQQLLSLSKQPNIYIKLSGFYYSSSQTAPFSDVIPYVQAFIDTFGAQRCIWGSDFPFIMDHWNYTSALNWISELGQVSKEDRDWILGNTAKMLWW